ncbi:MAG TPA: PAS domain-containing protein [Gammaproteobacteria bacterium]|nr:PAS domain-containing protein [Gammaproteobacteria bacterium]
MNRRVDALKAPSPSPSPAPAPAPPRGRTDADDRLGIIAEGSPNGFFYVNRNLEIELANREFAKQVGEPHGELKGRPLRDVLGPAEFALHEPQLERALDGEQVVYEACVERAGATRFYRVSNRPVAGRDGRPRGVFSEAADITELKRLEREARESEARFRMLAQGVPNQLLFLDKDLRIEFANDVFLQASGWSAETAKGRHISELLAPERYLERVKYYERALAGETVSYESTGAAGSQAGYFRFSYRPSFDAEGRIQGIFSLAVDVTERRRVELELEAKQAELVRSNRDLEQFAYVASHDLKAPLRAIDLLVQWIKEELGDYDKGSVQENLGLLGQRTQRLSRLLDDLLAYSRAGRKVGACRRTDCHALVLDVIQLLNPPETFAIKVDGRLPTLETYPVPLEQVFRNLINNAIKHHPGPRGEIKVACEETERHYVFSVEDDGTGIPQEYAERVFEMFQTLKPRDQVEGSGMGLAIVSRIVSWQGGRVWFEPRPAGSGTVFKFQWSKQPPPAAPEIKS